MSAIYVDHAAATPVSTEAAAAMMDVMQSDFGNPSSIHTHGRQARKQLDEARRKLAATIHAAPEEIVFTGTGTEADNLAVTGYAHAHQHKGNHIVTSAIEHHAVLHTCRKLETEGFDVTYLAVDEEGRVHKEQVKEAVTEQTILITIMHGNNEVGTLQPIQDIAAAAAEEKIAFHTDAVQSYGIEKLDVQELPVTMLTASSHKINGPKGAAFLYVRKGTSLTPGVTGGEQERKRRAGTENVPAAAGFAAAAEAAVTDRQSRRKHAEALRSCFLACLQEHEVSFTLNGPKDHYLPHIVNIHFPGIEVESFLVRLDMEGVSASSGSACTAGSVEPSHVLQAMYQDDNRAEASVRFSFGPENTKEEMEELAAVIKKITGSMQADIF
ncbi:cysteine desulfurase family protein [Salibacterium halotolerans]|uniref:Cysteine desulfurase n=1 Tax=Salibacterium halotolerans TaxID=1884432 RepID=A0A1I5UDW5_9BACI|nr:cysteine desulfurase family protein [Salibacterium halotolerans]SFP93207.1 cysteine desulfurase [Salibacterium halotolerans]